ncbi:hypothetical protein BsWGS_17098 [Bradybaena similaris]
MPLSHSQNFGGFGYGDFGSSDSSSMHSLCHKRKIDVLERTPSAVHGDYGMKTDYHESDAKRPCQRVSSDCPVFEFHQNGNHGEDVNMEEDRADLSQNERPCSNDQEISNCCQQGVTESSASMDADSLPATESHIQSHTTSSVSSPQNIAQETIRRGLKHSPVSGRLFCHCSASWRGMYGLDIGYITDYY